MPRHHRQKSRSAVPGFLFEIDIRHFIFGPKSRALDGVGSREAHCRHRTQSCHKDNTRFFEGFRSGSDMRQAHVKRIRRAAPRRQNWIFQNCFLCGNRGNLSGR